MSRYFLIILLKGGGVGVLEIFFKIIFVEAVLTSTYNLCFEQKIVCFGCKIFNTFEWASFRNDLLSRNKLLL